MTGILNGHTTLPDAANKKPLLARIGCGLRGSLQRFGEFLGWCHPVEGLSRSAVELMSGEVEVVLGECCHVGAFG